MESESPPSDSPPPPYSPQAQVPASTGPIPPSAPPTPGLASTGAVPSAPAPDPTSSKEPPPAGPDTNQDEAGSIPEKAPPPDDPDSENAPGPAAEDAPEGASEKAGEKASPIPTKSAVHPAPDSAWILSYQDFVPNQLAAAQATTSASYEPFSTLVVKANQWLQQNPGIKVKVCETITTRCDDSTVNTNTSSFHQVGKPSTTYVRSLRMWVVPKVQGDNPAPQQIGYLNFQPQQLSEGGACTKAQYATFGETITRLNERFTSQPLPGRIVNVETIDLKCYGDTIGAMDPDESSSPDRFKHKTFFLNVIRVYYEVGPSCNEQIGSIDFAPTNQKMSSKEPLSTLLTKVNSWIQQNPNLPVCNIQTLNFKLNANKDEAVTDTQRSYFYEPSCMGTPYMRIIRVYYVRGAMYRPLVQKVSYKTFTPAPLSANKYEDINQCMNRAMTWLKLTNAKVIGCETQAVKMEGSGNLETRAEGTYFTMLMSQCVIVIRVFMDGEYQEPAPELLPPVPQNQSKGAECCDIL